MNSQHLIFLSLLIFFLSSCSSTRIISDYERGTNFNQYKTFSMLEHGDNFPVGANPINKQRIERAIENGMIKLGYQKTEDADLAVTWFVKIDVHHYLEDHRNYYERWRTGTMPVVNWYEYKVGTLVIDLIDLKENKTVWHGAISGTVEAGMKKVGEKIYKAVEDLLGRYKEEVDKLEEVVR